MKKCRIEVYSNIITLVSYLEIVGYELNSEYVQLANKRIEPLLKQVRLF